MALKIYFGSLAADYIADSGRNVKEVAEALPNTPANQFSKWKTGRWTYIAEKKLLQLVDIIARNDRQKRVNLIIAYVIDMTPEAYRPLIDIKPRSGESEDAAGLTGNRWSPTLRAKIEAIGEAYGRDPDFMNMADQLGRWAATINKRADTPKG